MMDEKEKLVELIINAPKIPIVIGGRNIGKTYQTAEHLVDHLIANGVTVRQKGEWVITKRHTISRNPYMDDNYHIRAECSECNFCIHAENRSFGYAQLNTTNFCPNCGADMRVEYEIKLNELIKEKEQRIRESIPYTLIKFQDTSTEE